MDGTERINPNAFHRLHKTLLSCGKLRSSRLSDTSGPNSSGSVGKVNAIVRAQAESSLYDACKLAADPLKKAKLSLPKTTGKGWFDIEPLEMDEKLKKDVKMIQLRNYMDPKRFYKNPDKVGQVLHVGTVIEGAAEYKSARLTNKERKQDIVGEILADQKIKDYSKSKFAEINAARSKKLKAYKARKSDKVRKQKKIQKLF